MNAILETNEPRVLISRIGVMTYLSFKGSLENTTGQDELRATVKQCIDRRETKIVIDMHTIKTLNSVALECLLDIKQQLIQLGGWLKVTNLNNLVSDIFLITGMLEHIPVIESDSGSENVAIRKDNSGRKMRLGDILLDKGLLTEKQIDEAISLQRKLDKKIGQIIIDKGWVTENEVLKVLASQLSIPYITLRNGMYDAQVVSRIAKEMASRLKVLPLFVIRDEVVLATSDPQDYICFDEIEKKFACRVRPVIVLKEDITKTIEEIYSEDYINTDYLGEVDADFELLATTQPDDYAAIDELAAGSPVINLVNAIIQRAVKEGASDVHIEPSRARSRIRYRIDGVLYETFTPRIELHPAIVSRLKVMANLDIAERRLPQDGRIQVQTQGRAVDLRFSSLPGLYGEKVVLRILDKNQSILDIKKLGMSKSNIQLFSELLDRSYGLILVTGPTGSGKTTSLYAALNHLNSIEKNIVTIEDPVEYQVDIINQNEVKEKIGLSFARVLKHVLRQDPDIIMVGEIREKETAEIAVQAALTGHLVLSTLHTNDSIGAVTRMIDMGVEPFMLSSALIGVIAQRLVRSICPHCRTTYIAPQEIVSRYGWEQRGQVSLAKGRGCKECYDSGYKGRISIHEILPTNNELQKLIVSKPNRDELNEYIVNNSISTLLDDGMSRVADGITTIEEIVRVVNT